MFLRESVAIYRGCDPAARSALDVVLCDPGLHATLWDRISHGFWRGHAGVLAPSTAHSGRGLTGIEINLAANLGRRQIIAHGKDVVTGETAEIGDDVYVYHQVTQSAVTE